MRPSAPLPVLLFLFAVVAAGPAAPPSLTAERFTTNPLLHGALPAIRKLGDPNLNGPSALEMPDWVEGRLGRYYLYFASHTGTSIRLAYADDIHGPWTVHPEGVVQARDVSICRGHIASPDAHLEGRTVWLFVHCGVRHSRGLPVDWDSRSQCTVAVSSSDGLRFVAAETPRFVGPFYFRLFTHEGAVYALAKRRGAGGGVLYRCPLSTIAGCAATPFSRGPKVIDRMRHAAVANLNGTLWVLYSRVGDAPESIYAQRFDLRGDWRRWGAREGLSDPGGLLLAPEAPYEGGRLPVEPSGPGPSLKEARRVQDPALLRISAGEWVLFYSAGGERTIAAATLRLGPRPAS